MASVEARLASKTLVVGECHEWQGERTRDGYGRICLDGRKQLVHRVVWALEHGPIPEGMVVCHHCDNPPCSRIDHLFLGTKRDNSLDCKAKGRHRPCLGEGNGRARLTSEQVASIRARLGEGEKQVVLAREFGMPRQSIWKIAHGKQWV